MVFAGFFGTSFRQLATGPYDDSNNFAIGTTTAVTWPGTYSWGGNPCTNNGFGGSLTPQPFGSGWAQYKMGRYSIVARRLDGSLWSWVCNVDGNIGQGTLDETPTPTQIGSATNWDAIAASSYHMLARRSDGSLWASGNNGSGQLGNGTNSNSNVLVQSLQAPAIGAASAGAGSATVSFTPLPATYNPVTGYRAISTPGGFTGTCTAPCSGITVSGLSAGTSYTITVAATNSAGNGQDSAASNSVVPTVTTTFTVTPSAGANGSISPSVAQTVTSGATSAFTVTPNSGYSATVGGTCTGSLVGTTYTTAAVVANCTVIASFTLNMALNTVQSRKIHGGAGTFDLLIDTTLLTGGLVTVEPRAIGSGHSIVFQFNQAVTSIGSVTAVDTNGNPIRVANGVINAGNSTEVIVTLTGVADANRVTITVNNVAGAGNTLNQATASMGYLVGDVNNSRSVSNTDISAIKTRAGQPLDNNNFKYDVNASGGITNTDISATKTRAGAGI